MLNLLVVDFDSRTSEAFKRVFKKLGYHVDSAQSKEEAFELMRNKVYDCMLISFSPSDSYEDLLLFTKKNMPNVVTAVLTNYPTLQRTEMLIGSEADAVFSKPVNMSLLVKAVKDNIECTPEHLFGINQP